MWRIFASASALVGVLAGSGCGEDVSGVFPGRFADPDEFDRTGCDGGAPLSSVDPVGIWHLDLHYEFGSYAVPVRFDLGGPNGLLASLQGRATEDVRRTERDLFVRAGWQDQQVARTLTMDGCRVDPDGAVFGHFASCRNDDCALATFQAYPVPPLAEPEAAGVRLVGRHDLGGAIAANVRVLDGRAYAVTFGDGMRILNVDNPNAPVEIGHAPVAFDNEEYFNDVKMVRRGGMTYALVASNRRGVVVIDVSDPTAPREVTAFPPAVSGDSVGVHTLFVEDLGVQGVRAYLANTTISGLDIYEVGDPARPRPLGQFVHPSIAIDGGYLHDLFVSQGRAYLNYWDHGLVIVDTLVAPGAPALVGEFNAYERRTSHSNWVTSAGSRLVSAHGDEDFDAHVRIVDVDQASATFLQELGAFQTRPQVSVHNILAVGEVVLATYYQDGLRVIDLVDPENPVEIAHYATWPGAEPGYGRSFFEGAIGVDYDNATGLIYVVDTHRGLFILSLDP